MNVEGGLKLKFMFCFMGITYEWLHLRRIKFGTEKYNGHAYKF
jgi:hypothetical protein